MIYLVRDLFLLNGREIIHSLVMVNHQLLLTPILLMNIGFNVNDKQFGNQLDQ